MSVSRSRSGPRSSPNRITEDIKQQAIGVRAALEQSGLDHGPISVHDFAYVTALGVEAITGNPYKPTMQGKSERRGHPQEQLTGPNAPAGTVP